MSLYRSLAFLKVNTNAIKAPNSVKGLQLNNQFNYIDRPSSSKGDNYSITPLRPSSPSTKLGVQSPSSSPIRCSFSSSAFTAG